MDLDFTPHIKIKSKCIIDLNRCTRTVKFLEENIENLCIFGLSRGFFRHEHQKQKWQIVDYVKLRTFVL